MKRIENIQQLKIEFSRCKSGVADDTIFGAKALLFIAEKLDELTKEKNNGRKRTRQGNEVQQRIASNRKRKEIVPESSNAIPVALHQEAQVKQTT